MNTDDLNERYRKARMSRFMNTDDLNERYRKAQMSRLPDYRDGFEAGRMSMRWWLAASMVVSFCWGIVIARVML